MRGTQLHAPIGRRQIRPCCFSTIGPCAPQRLSPRLESRSSQSAGERWEFAEKNFPKSLDTFTTMVVLLR